MAKFPTLRQVDSKDCGPTCLRMIAHFYGKKITLSLLNDLSNLTRIGTSLDDIGEAAEKIGFRSLSVKVSFEIIKQQNPLPAIIHWQKNHFVVLYKTTKRYVYIADPAIGRLKFSHEEFLRNWSENSKEGFALLLEPTPLFYSREFDFASNQFSISYFTRYLIPHKRLFFQIFLGLIAGSILGLMMPFLTQSLIDIGIHQRNLNFIYLILLIQMMFFLGSTSITAIRRWIILHISVRLNISIISDFLVKLMKLPIRYFDQKNIGDLLQRIRDHDRIQNFLTSGALQSVFSLLNIVVFGGVLLYYSLLIFSVFFVGSLLYVIWVIAFLKKRREIDFRRFREQSASQSNEVQLILGMQEIKLNHAERYKRYEWEQIQVRLFNVRISSLTLEQLQEIGGSFLNESKNILVMFIAATQVLSGDLSLGMMMAVSQIIGQLNSPLHQLIGFTQQAQDAKISLDRLAEIHSKKNEDDEGKISPSDSVVQSDIHFNNVSFKYGGSKSPWVIRNASFVIPAGKTTAIVGPSGSGKTSILKLLLKFHEPQKGQITVSGYELSTISNADWRKQLGVVMQEGFLFSDTILKNVTISDEKPDITKFDTALSMANIMDFVYKLPLGFETRIGHEGVGLSLGQKQRLMIARAIYKNPKILLLDEATSSLDAINENEISQNIKSFSKNRTTLIIAHRLSTVRDADQIIVLNNGEILEIGSHEDLIFKKGQYYSLIKNQLDLA